MKVTKYTGLIGAFFVLLTLAIFIGFFYWLKGPFEYAVLVEGKPYNLGTVMLIAAVAALVFNFCGLVAIKLIGARKFDQEYIQFKPAKSKAFWMMYAVTLIIYEIFVLFWHGDI